MTFLEYECDELYPIMVDRIITILRSCKIVSDKVSTKRAKNVRSYFYTDGAYDTETSTIKELYTRYQGKIYRVIKDKMLVPDNGNYQLHEIKGDVFEKPIHSWIYHIQIMVSGIYITFRYIDNAVSFLRLLSDKISELNLEKNPKLIIWVANLSFEWAFLLSYFKNDVTDYFAKSPTKPLYIEINHNIVLKECIGLFGKSLSDIAKHHTKTQKLKGDLNYDLIRTPITPLKDKEREYCYNDVKILSELSYIALDKWLCKHMPIPLTETGILRQEVRILLKKRMRFVYSDNFKLIPFHEDIDNKCDLSWNLFSEWRRFLYVGGYAHSNYEHVGKILNDDVDVDITSAYPFHMLTKKYPAGELIHTNKHDIQKILKNNHYIIKVMFSEIVSRGTHSFISRCKIINISDTYDTIFDNGRLLRGKNVMLWLNEVDFENMKLMYTGKFEIIDCWHFTDSRLIDKKIRDLIAKYYIDKKNLKSKHLPYHDEKVKINSFYGFYATRIYNEVNRMIDGIIKQNIDEDFSFKKNASHIMLNPYVAYWTTAYTRQMLVNFISKYPDIIVQYDTDSLFASREINNEMFDNFMRAVKIENDRTINDNMCKLNNAMLCDLGTWDIAHIDKIKCLGAKRYVYTDTEGIHSTIAGLPKGALINYLHNETDIFNMFDDEMYLPITASMKLTCAYRRDTSPITITVTDYMGNVCDVTCRSYAALYRIPFKMTIQDIYLYNCKKVLN